MEDVHNSTHNTDLCPGKTWPTKLAASFPHPRSRGFRRRSLRGKSRGHWEWQALSLPDCPVYPARARLLPPKPERPRPAGSSGEAQPGLPSRLSSARPGRAFRPPRQRSERAPRRLSRRSPYRPGPPRPWRPHSNPGPWGPQEAAAPGRGGGGGRHHVCRPSQKPSAGRTKRGGGGADTQADPADPRQTSGARSPGNPAP